MWPTDPGSISTFLSYVTNQRMNICHIPAAITDGRLPWPLLSTHGKNLGSLLEQEL